MRSNAIWESARLYARLVEDTAEDAAAWLALHEEWPGSSHSRARARQAVHQAAILNAQIQRPASDDADYTSSQFWCRISDDRPMFLSRGNAIGREFHVLVHSNPPENRRWGYYAEGNIAAQKFIFMREMFTVAAWEMLRHPAVSKNTRRAMVDMGAQRTPAPQDSNDGTDVYRWSAQDWWEWINERPQDLHARFICHINLPEHLPSGVTLVMSESPSSPS